MAKQQILLLSVILLVASTTFVVTSPLPQDVIDSILSQIDTTVDPCEDFYQHACGGYIKKTPPDPAAQIPMPKMFVEIANRTRYQELALFNRGQFPLNFYSTCTDLAKREATGAAALHPVFQLIDRVISSDPRDFWRVLGTLHRHNLADDILFTWSVQPVENINRWVMTGRTPRLSIFTDSIRRMYTLLDSLGLSHVGSGLDALVMDYPMVESTLYELTKDSSAFLPPINNYYPSQFDQFQFYFTEYLKGLGTPSPISDTATITVAPQFAMAPYPDFWPKIGSWISKAYLAPTPTLNPSLLQAMLQLHVIVRMLEVLPSEFSTAWYGGLWRRSNRASHSNFPPRDNDNMWRETMQPDNIPPPLWDNRDLDDFLDRQFTGDEAFCFQYTIGGFGNAVVKQWVDEYFPRGNKDLGTDLVNNIHLQMGQRLGDAQWLDAETRRAALAKWSLIVRNVAYDTDWDDFSDVHFTGIFVHDILAGASHFSARSKIFLLDRGVNRTHFPQGVNVMDQNAFYYPTMNSINMLAGLMLEPLFASRYPTMLTTAMYGFVIGHEITHGFDNNGRQFNGTGERVNWWTPAAEAAFNDRAKCLVNQYDSFYVTPTTHVNGESTLGENIADLGGVGVAWATYLANERVNPTPLLMPASTGITNDQLYWIVTGQVWCSVGTPEQFETQVKYDVHSPGIYRINGPLSNLPGFAQTYKCPPSSPMGRSLTSNQCVIW